jgi:hypothetical protein
MHIGIPMGAYESVFLGPDGGVAARRQFQAASDSEAVIIARALYAERATRDGMELWEDTRRVYTEDEVQPSAT